MTPDQDLSARLLPCPFCGGEAEIWRAHMERTAWIGCMGKCSVLVSREYKTDAEAIAAWNTRAPTDHERTVQAAVAKAVEAEREAAKQLVWTLGHEIRSAMLVDEDNEQTVLDMVKATAAAIRSRGVAG